MNWTSLWCLAECMDALFREHYSISTLCSSQAQAACSISLPCSAPTSMTKPHSAMPTPHVGAQSSHLITFAVTLSSACLLSHHHDVIIATPVALSFSLLSDDDFNAPVRNWFPVSTLHTCLFRVFTKYSAEWNCWWGTQNEFKQSRSAQMTRTAGLICETAFFLLSALSEAHKVDGFILMLDILSLSCRVLCRV